MSAVSVVPFEPLQKMTLDDIIGVPVDANGICKFYYQCPNRGTSNFPKPDNIADVRHIELHFHMQPDARQDRIMYPFDPSDDFLRQCPIWYFLDEDDKAPKPTCTIFVTYHGVGDVYSDYRKYNDLLGPVMEHLTSCRFEEVWVKVMPGLRRNGTNCLPPPTSGGMRDVTSFYEEYMGKALLDERLGGDFNKRRMLFCPRFYKEFLILQQAAENTRAASGRYEWDFGP